MISDNPIEAIWIPVETAVGKALALEQDVIRHGGNVNTERGVVNPVVMQVRNSLGILLHYNSMEFGAWKGGDREERSRVKHRIAGHLSRLLQFLFRFRGKTHHQEPVREYSMPRGILDIFQTPGNVQALLHRLLNSPGA